MHKEIKTLSEEEILKLLGITEEERKNLIFQSNIRLLLLYILPDICEALMVDIEGYRKKALVPPLKFKDKIAWKGLFKSIGELHTLITDTNIGVQESYAETCDYFQQLLLYALDRCSGEDIRDMQQFIDYIKSFPSKRHIEI